MGSAAVALCYTLTIGCCDEVVSVLGAQAPNSLFTLRVCLWNNLLCERRWNPIQSLLCLTDNRGMVLLTWFSAAALCQWRGLEPP
jgi:hypothetical protein